jgi:hypothetical protein
MPDCPQAAAVQLNQMAQHIERKSGFMFRYLQGLSVMF